MNMPTFVVIDASLLPSDAHLKKKSQVNELPKLINLVLFQKIIWIM